MTKNKKQRTHNLIYVDVLKAWIRTDRYQILDLASRLVLESKRTGSDGDIYVYYKAR